MSGGWAFGNSSRNATGGTQIGTRKPAFVEQSARGKLRLIKLNDVESLIQLSKNHPVYLLTFTDGEKLVLKCERANITVHKSLGSASAQAGSVVMSFVSAGHVSEVLVASEIKIIEQLPTKLIPLAQDVDAVKNKQSFFTKMPFFATLVDLDIHSNDKTKVAAYAAELAGNKELIHQVGKVIAADLFIGNLDRLSVPKVVPDDPSEMPDISVGNYGNFLFKTDAKGRLVGNVGLDTWDSTNTKVANLYGSNIEEWKKRCGVFLDKSKGTKHCADAVIKSFKEDFAGNDIHVQFGPVQTKCLEKGMHAGIEGLKKNIVALISRGSKVPSGVMARADYLGWSKGVYKK